VLRYTLKTAREGPCRAVIAILDCFYLILSSRAYALRDKGQNLLVSILRSSDLTSIRTQR